MTPCSTRARQPRFHLTLVALNPAMVRQAVELATAHRLRGADAVYLAVARRYATNLISRDEEQLRRGSGSRRVRHLKKRWGKPDDIAIPILEFARQDEGSGGRRGMVLRSMTA